jgi:hypothetical protein
MGLSNDLSQLDEYYLNYKNAYTVSWIAVARKIMRLA